MTSGPLPCSLSGGPLKLAEPLRVLFAELGDDGAIACGTLRIAPQPSALVELCRRLVAAGAPDVGLRLVHAANQQPAGLVLSIAAVAAFAEGGA